MRPTRVIYVENDPALRGIVTRLLSERPELTLLLAAENGSDVLDSELVRSSTWLWA